VVRFEESQLRVDERLSDQNERIGDLHAASELSLERTS